MTWQVMDSLWKGPLPSQMEISHVALERKHRRDPAPRTLPNLEVPRIQRLPVFPILVTLPQDLCRFIVAMMAFRNEFQKLRLHPTGKKYILTCHLPLFRIQLWFCARRIIRTSVTSLLQCRHATQRACLPMSVLRRKTSSYITLIISLWKAGNGPLLKRLFLP